MSLDDHRHQGSHAITAWCPVCRYRSLYNADGLCLWCEKRIIPAGVARKAEAARRLARYGA